MDKMLKALALCALSGAVSAAFAQAAPAQLPRKSAEAVFTIGGEVREGAPAKPEKADRQAGANAPGVVSGQAAGHGENASKDEPRGQGLAAGVKPAGKQVGDRAPKELISKLSGFYGEHLAHMDVEMEAKMECVDSSKAVAQKKMGSARKEEQAGKVQADMARFESQLECLSIFKSRLPGRVQAQAVAKWVDVDAFKAAYESGLTSPISENLALQRLALKIAAYWQIASLEASFAQGVEQALSKVPALEAGLWGGIERNRGELGAVKAYASATAAPEELEVAESMAESIGSESFQALQALYVAKNVGLADAASRASDKGDKKPLESFGVQFDAWMGEMVATKLKP